MSCRKNWSVAASSCWKGEFSHSVLEAYEKAGIYAMELSASPMETFMENWRFTENAKSMVNTAKSHGVSISSLHLPFGPFEVLDPAGRDANIRAAALAFQKELVRAAGDAGIPVAVVHPSGEPYLPEEREERMSYALDFLASLARTAQSAGVKLACEDLPRTCLCSVKEEYARFLEIPELYGCFDTNHSLQQPNEDFIRAAKGKIITLHVSDYDFIDERHWLPGKGKNDWEAILSALEETGYDGFFTYEVHCEHCATLEEMKANYDQLMEGTL